ncbi:MAG: hypothetical protein MN733_28810 [Nitrososphaera sp.]|nr:hypothetical protein [Nitrososphaera sp.]
MATRTFEAKFIVTVGDDKVTTAQVKEFLDEALIMDVDMEENGNPIGLQSAEVITAELKEVKQKRNRTKKPSK